MTKWFFLIIAGLFEVGWAISPGFIIELPDPY